MNTRKAKAAWLLAAVLAAPVAWAKLPPAPPMSEEAKAAAAEKKAAAAAQAKQDLDAARERAVQNYQANMKKAGKPVPKATPVVAAAAPAKDAKTAAKAAPKK